MEFVQFIEWAFYGAMSLGVLSAVRILSHLNDSVESLNIKIAQVIEKTLWIEKNLEYHNQRIQSLEERKKP